METQIKKRIDWLDIAKGIAIICTIIGHSFGKNRIGVFIFSFHMPIFFILSGYTLKKIQFSEFTKAIFKDFKRLIIPVFVVFVIDFILQILFSNKSPFSLMKSDVKRFIWGTCNRGVGRLWFLVALFYSKFFFRIVLNKIQKYREIFLLLGTYIFSVPGLKIELPQNLDLIFVAMLFMDAGYILRNSVDENSPKIEKLGIGCFFVWVFLVWNHKVYTDLAQRLYPPLAIVAALCGSLCVIQLSKIFECSKFLTKIIGFFGKWSLDLLCIHQLDGYFSKYVNLFTFKEGVKLAKLNPYIHCCVNLLLNILILLAWTGIRYMVMKIYKSSKHTLTKGRVTG